MPEIVREEPVTSVLDTLHCLVALAPRHQRKYLDVPSRTSELAKLAIGSCLFAVKFLHFLLNLSAIKVYALVRERFNKKCKQDNSQVITKPKEIIHSSFRSPCMSAPSA